MRAADFHTSNALSAITFVSITMSVTFMEQDKQRF